MEDANMTPLLDLAGHGPRDTLLNRRAVLSGAMVGFVLTAGGLFLPDDMAETEARDSAYDGQLGGRHGKDHRGRDKRKRRERGDKKNTGHNQPPRAGGGLFRDTALTVAFALPSGYAFSFSKTFYYRQKTGLDTYGPWIASSVDSNRYDPLRFRVGVLVKSQSAEGAGPDLFVDVRNHAFLYPIGNIYSGSALDPPKDKLGTSLLNEYLFELEATIAGTFPRSVETEYTLGSGRKAAVKLTRNLDTERIEFALLITGK
jgi:hypothetical protein